MFTILCEKAFTLCCHFAFQIDVFLRQLRARSNSDILHKDMYYPRLLFPLLLLLLLLLLPCLLFSLYRSLSFCLSDCIQWRSIEILSNNCKISLKWIHCIYIFRRDAYPQWSSSRSCKNDNFYSLTLLTVESVNKYWCFW